MTLAELAGGTILFVPAMDRYDPSLHLVSAEQVPDLIRTIRAFSDMELRTSCRSLGVCSTGSREALELALACQLTADVPCRPSATPAPDRVAPDMTCSPTVLEVSSDDEAASLLQTGARSAPVPRARAACRRAVPLSEDPQVRGAVGCVLVVSSSSSGPEDPHERGAFGWDLGVPSAFF